MYADFWGLPIPTHSLPTRLSHLLHGVRCTFWLLLLRGISSHKSHNSFNVWTYSPYLLRAVLVNVRRGAPKRLHLLNVSKSSNCFFTSRICLIRRLMQRPIWSPNSPSIYRLILLISSHPCTHFQIRIRSSVPWVKFLPSSSKRIYILHEIGDIYLPSCAVP